jgi:hypothetical protein
MTLLQTERLFIGWVSALVLSCVSCAAAALLQDPWEEGYANLDATGVHVIGCWKFDEFPLADAAGHGAYVALQGASLIERGRFGGGLKCGSGNDTARHAAVVVADLPRHSPSGAFSAEMWVRVSADSKPSQTGCLLDKQGAQMECFRWSLTPANERGLRQMAVSLGFGMFLKEFVSEPMLLPAGEWRHLAFTYDGAGRVAFFCDSQPVGESFEERCGPVQPSGQPLSIGCGIAGDASFDGDIDEVRLSTGVRGFAAFSLEIKTTRNVWERMERPLPMKITCTNLRRRPLNGVDMTYKTAGVEQSFIFPDLAPGESNVNEYGPDTSLKPGSYTLEVIMGKGSGRVSRLKEFHIVARRLQMLPVIMEGAALPDLPQLQPLACTHWTGLGNDDAPYLGTATKLRPAMVQPVLDAGLRSGLRTIAALDHDPVMLSRGLRHVGRDGKETVPPMLDVSNPSSADFMAACGNMFTIYYRDFHAWASVWLKSSALGQTQMGFSKASSDAYRKFSGQDIPAEIQNSGLDWRKLPGFPNDRVLPDDHPILKYYHWFWSGGNGRKAVNEAWYRAYVRRKQDRPHTWTLHDSCVQQPSRSGAYSSAMYIGDQSSDTRDPLLAGLCVDQQLAMSAAHQLDLGVFGIMPLSWDRSLVSPDGGEETGKSIAQADAIASAQRISIAPAILKENLWMMMSRPVKGIVCTDWPALRSNTEQMKNMVSATHPQSYAAFRDVADRLLFPLGPMLARRQPWRSSIALLESFTSQMLAGRGIYRGGSPRTLEVWQALQRAHLQADIVYEEILAAGGLDGRQILIMTECDVLPASVVEILKKWQKQGGKIVSDEHLCPALKPDALLSEMSAPVVTTNSSKALSAASDTATPASVSLASSVLPLPERLSQICKDLGCQPRLGCDNPDVILHASQTGEAVCLFVINDSREPGDYVGKHGLVRESGLPVTTTLNLGQDNVNVYDLTRAAFVLPKRSDNGLTIPLKLGPSEGRVLLLSPAPLLEMNLELPETASCGNVAEAVITLLTSGGRPMPAAIPVSVRIRDSDGAAAEWDGYHVVENGMLTLRLNLARNETPGTWEVQVRELASGMETVKWMQVRR